MKVAVILLPLLVQLATGAAFSRTAVCPEQEDIHPCKCSVSGITLEITCTGALTDIQEALSRNKKFLREQDVYQTRLIGVKAVRLPSLFFSGLRTIKLAIQDCDLKDLAECDGAPAFSGVHDLMEVYIDKSIKGDNELTNLHLEHLEKLITLTLWKNNIPEIRNDFFRNGPYNLQWLTIGDCGVRTIGDRAFEALTNLRNLRLSDNLFQTFPRSMLPVPAASLLYLDLSYGNLSRLPEDAFTEMPALTQVDLKMNPMGRIPEVTWSSIWPQLRQIYFAGNPLECDSHIEWIFKMKKPWDISGWCVSPEDRKGKKLADLISENQKSTV